MSYTITIDDIAGKFPIKTIPSIDGEPTYATIHTLLQLLYTNAASVPSSLGGVNHGHLGLIMNPTRYATLSDTSYVVPPDPGLTPAYPNGKITLVVRQSCTDAHKVTMATFNKHTHINDLLKSHIIDAVDEVYLHEKSDKYTGYLGVSSQELIDHLLDRYGKISSADLENNKDRMAEPYDPSQPIDAYFKRIDDAVQYAIDGKHKFSDEQILQTAYHAINSAGLFMEACRE